jgi:hypothetical protein
MDAPLDKTRIVFCVKCKTEGLSAAAKHNREIVERTAQLIRELKSDPPVDSDREREILEKLAKVHPDLDGLKQAIKTRRDSKPQGSRVRRGSF